MDYLELADSLIRNVGGNAPPDEMTAASTMSIAATLIAIAERRPQFVQVDGRRFNAGSITQIEDFGDGITVYLASGPAAQLRGPAKAAFLLWHEQYADVVRLPQVPDAPTE